MKEKLTLKKFNAQIMVPIQKICNNVLPANNVMDHNNAIALNYFFSNVINQNISSISNGIFFSTNNSCIKIISEKLTGEIFKAKNSIMPDSAIMVNDRMNYRFGVNGRNISNYNQEITAQ